MREIIRRLAAAASAVIIFPALCLAQFGAIAGVVRDSSGAVLPGVTVEAASPVLIEKSRTAVSDDSGQYRVEQLRPGVYTVTFTLASFGTATREGIEISAGFTAPINVALTLGTVQETINVSDRAPVVDVQTVCRTEDARQTGARCAADGPVVRDARDDIAERDGQPVRCGRDAGRTREHPVGPRR